MNKKLYFLLLILFSLVFKHGYAQNQTSFKVIPLGTKGGLDESNLSAYLVAPAGSENFICADAGTIRHGIDIAINNQLFRGPADDVLKNKIKGYLISHAHLDHVAGLIMNSPDDSKKNIYAIPSVTEVLRDKYFTWKAWANFANEGELPRLGKYTYVRLKENKKTDLAGTEMQVTPFLLSHGPGYESTAFLISHDNTSLLYLGDTGADEIEKNTRLRKLWEQVAPLIIKNQLKAIFIETSFSNKQPENQLFGHLTPRLLMVELNKLRQLTGQEALQKVSIVITHMKAWDKDEQYLVNELKQVNSMDLKLVFPEQGQLLEF
ncbi:3',5'-cyclic-nucleotide phosphodiesterase [Pedobacter cryoconitis]|uniref:3',5'-cyclic-nucleotide phosphodiesterase n=1 Tax=Pedobacter cryoconitis TaxID=188932 RepID=A0A7W8ZHX5_9SPHI|nr:3',5'-cyclic-nucleotide phosphodiesterase [Pedobacter cryoconitis]MBB5634307.1 3',5'-cyclic-nucleotide phosphodiesterase [Pedobacter cryoconitis]